jgi:hypothetical protein
MIRRGAQGRGLLLWLPLAAALVGCGRPPTSALPSSRPAGLEPHAAAARLLALWQERRHAELRPLLAPASAAAVLDFLLALDDFADANRRLCGWLRDEVGLGLAHAIDQSYVLDELALYAGPELGLFGRDVELLDVHVADGRALVSYAIPAGLVAYAARFERRGDGGWQLAASSEQAELLRAAFADMATGVSELEAELAAGRYPPSRMRDDPEWLIEKTKARLRRGVGLLSRAAAAAQPASAPGAGS